MELDHLLKVLENPVRLKIFQILSERKHCVRSLAGKLGVSESAVSQYMTVIKDAGLIHDKKNGHHTHFSLHDAVDYLAEYFNRMRTALLSADRDMPALQCKCRKETPYEALGLGYMSSSVPSIISFMTSCYGIYY